MSENVYAVDVTTITTTTITAAATTVSCGATLIHGPVGFEIFFDDIFVFFVSLAFCMCVCIYLKLN